MTKAPVTKASKSIKKLEAKDGEPNNDSARTNEILAARENASDEDAAKASLEANDPTHSNAAYTSHKSGARDGVEDGK